MASFDLDFMETTGRPGYSTASLPHRLSPIDQFEGIAELLDALEVSGVARHQIEPVSQSDGGDHRIGPTDGLADTVEIPGNTARQFCGGLVKEKDFFGSKGGQVLVQETEALLPLEASNRFHDADD